MRQEPWGKTNTRAIRIALRRGEPPPRLRRHLLRHHALDAGFVMAALLAVPAVRRFLEQIIGASLRPADLERLCAVAFLHDFGKLDPNFQALDRLLPGSNPAPVPGPRPRHDLIAALVVAELRRPAAMAVPGVRVLRQMAGWFPPCEDEASRPAVTLPPGMLHPRGAGGVVRPFDPGVLEALAWHHGRVLPPDAPELARQRVFLERSWLAPSSPVAVEVEALLALAQRRFPLAFADAPARPAPAAFQHA